MLKKLNFGELAFRTKLPAASGIILFRITAPSSVVVAQKNVLDTRFQERRCQFCKHRNVHKPWQAF
jgi:hypothetical protein